MTTTPHSTIRPETAHDTAVIKSVTVAAFREAPHSGHTEQHIVRALRAAGALSVSLVAECDGELVGHVAASPVTLSDGTPDGFGLGPVSVLEESSRFVLEAGRWFYLDGNPVVHRLKPGRNTPCPCGSGRKFKACCGLA